MMNRTNVCIKGKPEDVYEIVKYLESLGGIDRYNVKRAEEDFIYYIQPVTKSILNISEDCCTEEFFKIHHLIKLPKKENFFIRGVEGRDSEIKALFRSYGINVVATSRYFGDEGIIMYPDYKLNSVITGNELCVEELKGRYQEYTLNPMDEEVLNNSKYPHVYITGISALDRRVINYLQNLGGKDEINYQVTSSFNVYYINPNTGVIDSISKELPLAKLIMKCYTLGNLNKQIKQIKMNNKLNLYFIGGRLGLLGKVYFESLGIKEEETFDYDDNCIYYNHDGVIDCADEDSKEYDLVKKYYTEVNLEEIETLIKSYKLTSPDNIQNKTITTKGYWFRGNESYGGEFLKLLKEKANGILDGEDNGTNHLSGKARGYYLCALNDFICYTVNKDLIEGYTQLTVKDLKPKGYYFRGDVINGSILLKMLELKSNTTSISALTGTKNNLFYYWERGQKIRTTECYSTVIDLTELTINNYNKEEFNDLLTPKTAESVNKKKVYKVELINYPGECKKDAYNLQYCINDCANLGYTLDLIIENPNDDITLIFSKYEQ